MTTIRAEVYETWWSLSKMTSDDALVTDAAMNPADFAEGASTARERAMAAYETLVRTHYASRDMVNSLRHLKAGQETQQRKWVCFSD